MGHDWVEGGPDSDTLLGGEGDDSLYAQGGDDGVEGGSGNDFISGGDGHDVLNAGSGDDVVEGGQGIDFLNGEEGDDELDGGDGIDLLLGGNGDDLLRGGAGNDELRGENGNDSLHGNAGDDELFGNAGIDGLYGGEGDDVLSGGADSDRFIDRVRFVFLGTFWQDDATDVDSEDVRIAISDGESEEGKEFAGLSGTYTVEAGCWKDEDVERVDQGLAVLHEATGNKEILETSNGNRIEFVRFGSVTEESGDSGSVAGWNSGGGVIGLADGTFNSGARRVMNVVIHEIAHNWDTEFDEARWHALSGWTESTTPLAAPMVMGHDASDEWWYDSSLNDAVFVTDYAETNPNEDFAESFTSFFFDLVGMRTSDELVPIRDISGKFDFMEDLLTELS